jgi:hypothetical protein
MTAEATIAEEYGKKTRGTIEVDAEALRKFYNCLIFKELFLKIDFIYWERCIYTVYGKSVCAAHPGRIFEFSLKF